MMLSIMTVNASSLEKDQELLRGILSRDEFTVYQSQGQNNLAQLLERFFKWLGKWFPDFSFTGNEINVISWVLIAVVTVLLIFMVYWFVRQVRRQRGIKIGHLLSADGLATDYNYYLRKARDFGDRGEWKEGIRHAFLALLLFLDHREWLRIEKWKTNQEYGTELGYKNRSWYEPFRGLALVFERVWYGKLSIDGGEFDKYLREVEAGIRKGEPGGPVE